MLSSTHSKETAVESLYTVAVEDQNAEAVEDLLHAEAVEDLRAEAVEYLHAVAFLNLL